MILSPRSPSALFLVLFLWGLMVCGTPLRAQEADSTLVWIRGSVVTEGALLPIRGALVAIPGLELRVGTDSLGRFRMRIPRGSAYHLSAEQLGYTSAGQLILPEAYDEPVRITMRPDPIMLEGLVVTVDRFRKRRKSYAYPSYAIDSETMRRAARSTTLFLLKSQIPGLSRCPGSNHYCALGRGGRRSVRACLDEFRAFGGVDRLLAYPPDYFYLIEIYKSRSGRYTVRAYSKRFVDRMTRKGRRLGPLEHSC